MLTQQRTQPRKSLAYPTGAVICFTAMLSACASVSTEGFKDPAFATATYNSVLVAAINVNLNTQSTVESGMCARLNATCFQAQQEFPPTRSWTKDEIDADIKQKGIASILILTLVSDNSQRRTAGYQTSGTSTTTGFINTYSGTANVSATSAGSSTTVPIVVFSRNARVTIQFIDTKSGQNAFVGDETLSGHGRFGASNKAFIDAAINGASKEILSRGFFEERKN